MAENLRIGIGEYGERIAAVRGGARARALDGVVAYGAHRDYQPADLRYLADWYCIEEETALLFIPLEGPTELVTDADWDLRRASIEAVADGTSYSDDLGSALAELIGSRCERNARIGVAGWGFFPASVYLEVRRQLPGVEIVDASQIVSDLRMIKSAGELRLMREAARISDAAMAAGIDMVTEGNTEFAVAAAAEHVIRSWSAEPSFVTEMGAGPRTAMGTFLPSSHRLAHGEVAVLDCGARVSGYHGDMCRTVVVGRVDARQRAMLEAVACAVCSAIEAAKPGVTVGDVRAQAARVIAEAGFRDYLWDSLMPHGNGTGQHEPPNANDNPDLPLREGMVLCMELGLAVPDHGAFNLEQMIAVTSGHAEVLNALPLALWE